MKTYYFHVGNLMLLNWKSLKNHEKYSWEGSWGTWIEENDAKKICYFHVGNLMFFRWKSVKIHEKSS